MCMMPLQLQCNWMKKISEFKPTPVKSSLPAKSHMLVVTPVSHTVPRHGNLAINKLIEVNAGFVMTSGQNDINAG